MAQENPTLYNYLGDLYNYNDLERAVYSNLDNYIASIEEGKKNELAIREALSNLLTGIKDNTITYSSGKFADSKGRYTNSKDENKDPYGWAATYLYNLMNKIKKYTPEEPEDTRLKWNNQVPSIELLNELYGTTDYYPNLFIDVDNYNSTTKSRATTERAKMLTEAIDNMLNNPNLFSNYQYTDADINRWKLLVSKLKDKLADGVTPNELIYLTRVFPGIKWDEMFSTTENLPTQQQLQLLLVTEEDFLNYLQLRSPRVLGDTAEIDLNYKDKLGNWTNNQYVTYLESLDDNQLYQLLGYVIEHPKTDFGQIDAFRNAVKASGGSIPLSANWVGRWIISTLNDRKKLANLDGTNKLVLFDDLTNSAFIYNTLNQKLYKKNLLDIPYFLNKFFEDFLKEQGIKQYPDWFSNYFTSPTYNKKGGVLKALSGTRTNIFFNESVPYAQIGLLHQNKDVLDWYNNYNTIEDYANAVKLNVDQRSLYGINNFNNSKRVTWSNDINTFNTGYLNNGNSLNNIFFGNSADTYNNNRGLAYTTFNFDHNSMANGNGDNYNDDPTKAYIDGLLGALTYLRTLSLTDPNLKTFGDWGEYWRKRGAIGAYYYKANKDSIGLWIPTADKNLEGLIAFGGLAPMLMPKIDRPNPQVNVNIKRPTNPKPDPKNTDVFPRTGTPVTYEYNKSNFWLNITPDLIGAGRLFASLHTNNKVADTIRESLNPVLIDTYERYSPITGAFSEMLMRNRQAANVRRLVARPFTSDASLLLAGLLDADRQARELEYQGFLADDKEIKRTQAEALARQEDNMARRSAVANLNRTSINLTDRERALLEATRLKSNWQSVDNFLQGLESRIRTNLAENKANLEQIAETSITNLYKDAISLLDLQYAGKTTELKLADPTYVEKVNRIKNRYQYDVYNLMLGKYIMNPYYRVPDTYQTILSSRKGGVLRPNVMSLINKVIKDENNS